jgi:ABC-type transport system substrate-binding protein
MTRAARLLGLALALLGALAGLGAMWPRAGGSLRIFLGADPSRPVPWGMLTPADRLLVAAVFGTLVVEEPDGTLRPGLARGWERETPVSADPAAVPGAARGECVPPASPPLERWTIHLDPLARFADGSRVTPADVIASWEKLLRSHGSPHRFLLDPVDGAAAFRAREAERIAGLAGEGSDLHVTLSRATPDFPARLAHPALGIGRPAREGALLGSGAFDAAPGELDVRGNPFHPAGKPQLDGFRAVAAGTVDPALLIDANAADAAIVYGRSAGRLLETPSANLTVTRWPAADRAYFLFLNPGSGFFATSVAIRRLLTHSVDREAMLRYLFDGRGETLTSLFPGGSPLEPMVPGTVMSGSRSHVPLTFDRDDPQAFSVAARVKAAWQEIGIVAELEGLDPPTLRDRIVRGDYAATIGLHQPNSRDPILALWETLAALGPLAMQNAPGLAQAALDPDPLARLAGAQRAEASLIEGEFLLPLVRLDAYLASRTRLVGVEPSQAGLLRLDDAWFRP